MCAVYGIDPSVNPSVHKLVSASNDISEIPSHGLLRWALPALSFVLLISGVDGLISVRDAVGI